MPAIPTERVVTHKHTNYNYQLLIKRLQSPFRSVLPVATLHNTSHSTPISGAHCAAHRRWDRQYRLLRAVPLARQLYRMTSCVSRRVQGHHKRDTVYADNR